MNYYESRFGVDSVSAMVPRMKAVAAECGVRLEYGGFVGNTFDSHVRYIYFCICMNELDIPIVLNDSLSLFSAMTSV